MKVNVLLLSFLSLYFALSTQLNACPTGFCEIEGQDSNEEYYQAEEE